MGKNLVIITIGLTVIIVASIAPIHLTLPYLLIALVAVAETRQPGALKGFFGAK